MLVIYFLETLAEHFRLDTISEQNVPRICVLRKVLVCLTRVNYFAVPTKPSMSTLLKIIQNKLKTIYKRGWVTMISRVCNDYNRRSRKYVFEIDGVDFSSEYFCEEQTQRLFKEFSDKQYSTWQSVLGMAQESQERRRNRELAANIDREQEHYVDVQTRHNDLQQALAVLLANNMNLDRQIATATKENRDLRETIDHLSSIRTSHFKCLSRLRKEIDQMHIVIHNKEKYEEIISLIQDEVDSGGEVPVQRVLRMKFMLQKCLDEVTAGKDEATDRDR